MALEGEKKEIVTKLRLDNKEFVKNMSQASKETLGMAVSFTAVGVAAAAAAKMTANYQDEMIKASRATGVAVEALSGLSYAAELSGVSAEQLGKSLTKLTSPSKDAQATLAQLGVSVRDASGQVKSADKTLAELSDKMAGLKNPADQARIAFKIFGDDGVKMVNMLADGSAGLKKLSDEAMNMGLIVSEQAGKNAEKFNDDIRKMELAVKGATMAVGESIIQFVNQSGIMETVRNIIMGFTQWWRNLDQGTRETIITIVEAVAAIGGIAVAIAAVIALAGPLKAAFSAMFGPIGLIFGAVTALVVGVIDNMDELKKANQGTFKAITEGASNLGKTLTDLKTTMSGATGGDAAKNMAAFASDVGKSSEEVSILGTIANTVFSKLGAMTLAVIAIFSTLGNVIKGAGNEINNYFAKAKLGYDSLVGKISFAEAAQKTQELAKNNAEVWGKSFDQIKADWEAAMKAVESDMLSDKTIRKTKKMLTDIKKTVADAQIGAAVINVKDFTLDPLEEAINKFSVSTTDRVKYIKLQLRDLIEAKSKAQTEVEKAPIQARINVLQNGKEGNAAVQKIHDFMGVVQAAAAKVQVAANAFSGLFSAMAAGSNYAAEVQLRDLEVVANQNKKAYEAQKADLTETEDAKIKAIEDGYDAQISAIQQNEAEKNAILEGAGNDRLLMLDAEYQAQRAAMEAQFAYEQELARQKFEAEKQIALEKTYDKEQRLVNESYMDAVFAEQQEAASLAHIQALNDFAKGYTDKQKFLDASLKATLKLNADTSAAEQKRITAEKAAALEAAEKDKNAKLAALDSARSAQEKQEEQQRLQVQYDAQMAEFESTKYIKAASTLAAGFAGAAQAFSGMTGATLGFGVGAASAVSALVLASTAVSVGNILSQKPIKPAGLMGAAGGLFSGPSHAQGGINANVEGGELLVSEARTNKIFDAIDRGSMMGGLTINFNGNINGSGEDVARMVTEQVTDTLRRQGIAAA